MGRAEIEEIVNKLILTKGEFASAELAAEAGISRQAVHRYLREMVQSGLLVRDGKGRAARYRPRKVAFNAHLRRTDGLAEDKVWDEARAAIPRLGEFEKSSAILAHAFTEMLNNAIDHSRSPIIDVSVEVDVDADRARFVVSDRGVGVFENVRAKLNLHDQLHALQEISKGKTTTDPERHTGEGIFFTSKMGQSFELEANGLVWIVDNVRQDQTIEEKPTVPGTIVRFETALRIETKLEDFYRPYTHDYEFDTSRIVIKLFEHGVRFVARSEAKRLLAGLERFRHVVLDFAGVEGVGQGFADEIFRVWVKHHPSTSVVAENMAAAVSFMVERARRATTGEA